MKHNKFLRFVVIISLVIGSVHAFGSQTCAEELSTTISGLTGNGADGGGITKSDEHFTVTADNVDNVGINIRGTNKATVSAKNGETITRIVFTFSDVDTYFDEVNKLQATRGTVSVPDGYSTGKTVTISDINANTVTLSNGSSSTISTMGFNAITIYYTGGTIESTYTITIPSTLTVSNTGWNALDGGISVDLSLESGKKLVVTASSSNTFNFVNQDDSSAKVAYYFLEGGDSAATFDSSDAQVSWNFTASGSKDIGIMVDDYSNMPAGTYKETVTFTVSVESNMNTLTISGGYYDDYTDSDESYSFTLEYNDDDTWQNMVDKYDYIYTKDYDLGPDGKMIKFTVNNNNGELKNEDISGYYGLVSVNAKVSDYTGKYYLDNI